eukprot:GHRQ01019621.1.p2 GENE.GHRQ01019621.1~~GHRQ01019621.1.p2  ORF type:complete len:148 (-),score=25.37 GHRQ01019621.1:552-995(-)
MHVLGTHHTAVKGMELYLRHRAVRLFTYYCTVLLCCTFTPCGRLLKLNHMHTSNLLCRACCAYLQPHGRDEHLITPKMWKHILVQGMYQMFWLFFFMYAAPVLFERYRITDNCTFATTGPYEVLPNPMFCTNELVSSLGFQVRCWDA